MMKQEFEKLIGETISDAAYALIEYVYQFHPLISATDGKNQVAMLYKTFGTSVFNMMTEEAKIAKDLEDERRMVREALDSIDRRVQLISTGRFEEEKCRRDAKLMFDEADSEEEFKAILRVLGAKYGDLLAKEITEEVSGYVL